jgi:hypothetical protein
MEIISAMDIKNGKTVSNNKHFNSFTQPIQFLSVEDKDESWAEWNLDWLEWQGIKQIEYKARRLMKNYKLAKGVIDKSDYLPIEDNDYSEMLDILTQADETAFELKFYPIIPNIINVLTNEFAKRNTKVDYRAVDDYSYNELMAAKYADVEKVLLEDAQHKLLTAMIEMGMDPQSPEAQQQFDPNALKKLPEIQEFYTKNFRTIGEQWAVKQHHIDTNRFRMDELEEEGFRDSLITDSEFWHFKMMADDYDVELWNPVLTFYHKSPLKKYISESNWAGKIDMITVADAIDILGKIMDEDQLKSLEQLHPMKGPRHMIDGIDNDGSLYDTSVSREENLKDSVAMKRYMSFYENGNGDDIVSWILGESEYTGILHDAQMLRMTTAYWKTQRKIGYLTSIQEDGGVITDIVDERYVVKNNPIYNTKLSAERNETTLVYGDHVEWIWINQTWGGIKLGPNVQHYPGNSRGAFDPIYLGIGQKKIGPLRFQFKGEKTVYGCKIPVEGRVYSDRNTKSTGLVDLLKPSQIGFNLTNNQINDIIIDEIGTVIALDHNTLPQHSMGEDWGKGNLSKAYVAMKDFSMLPLDTSMTNTENALNFQHFQVLDLAQTQRLMSRIQLANYFKQQAMELVGISPQRMGQQVGQTNTATGVEQAVIGSYTQTENYFIQHSDHLMPRVHQMRTDLAQYYHSSKSSIRMQSILSNDERNFFDVNGTDLLLIDINVFCNVNANMRTILEGIKNAVMSNNTTGASIFDLGEVQQADSLGTLNSAMKKIEEKAMAKVQQQQQAEKERYEAEIAARQQEKKMELDHASMEKEKDRRVRLMEAEIKASGYGAQVDVDQNMQSDFKDNMDRLQKTEQYQETMNFNREKENVKKDIASRKLDIEQQKANNMITSKQMELEVARTNKNKFDKK